MKVIWRGSIAFGLVNIPIELYSTTESHALSFTLLHEKCKTPLQYHRWCPHCKKEVQWHDTVKGIEKANGSYLVLTQEMLKELHPKKTEQITIIGFIHHDQIDPLYYNNHYYVAPTKNSSGYGLFIKAVESLEMIAIGRFVMRDKEYLVALQPYNNALLLTTLHYAYEIRAIDKLAPTKKAVINAKELKIAQTLIKALSIKKFDLTKFTNLFAQEIKELLQKKTRKNRITPQAVARLKKPAKKSSLLTSLTATLDQIKEPRRQRAAYAKKR